MTTKYYLQSKHDRSVRFEIVQFDRHTSTITFRDGTGGLHNYLAKIDDPDFEIAQFKGGLASLVVQKGDALNTWKPYRYCAEIEGTSEQRMGAVVMAIDVIEKARRVT